MFHLRSKQKCIVTPGFILLLGGIIYLDDGSGALLWIIPMAAIHELGHISAAACFGGRIKALKLNLTGAELHFVYPHGCSYHAECLIALMGPVCNLLLSVLLIWLKQYIPAMVGLCLGSFNLLPIVPLDGSRILYHFFAEHIDGPSAENIVLLTSAVSIGLVAGAGAVAMFAYANFLLLALAAWLLVTLICRHKKSGMLL